MPAVAEDRLPIVSLYREKLPVMHDLGFGCDLRRFTVGAEHFVADLQVADCHKAFRRRNRRFQSKKVP